jgi:hypothetical protein
MMQRVVPGEQRGLECPEQDDVVLLRAVRAS